MTKKLAAFVLGLAALVLNPFFACSVLQGFDFDAGDMRAAVEGTWTIKMPSGEYTVTIAQGTKQVARVDESGGLVAPAAACGSRSFVKTAGACVDSTRMPLDVQIVKGPSAKPSSGELEVLGKTFRAASLRLELDGIGLRAHVSPKGEFLGGTLNDLRTEIEMVRVAPAAPKS